VVFTGRLFYCNNFTGSLALVEVCALLSAIQVVVIVTGNGESWSQQKLAARRSVR